MNNNLQSNKVKGHVKVKGHAIIRSNVPSKLRACDFLTSTHSLYLLDYVQRRSRMLLVTRQANARMAK